MKAGSTSEPVRILLIEDNDADVDVIRVGLNAHKLRYKLTRLRDGAEALAFIRRMGKYAHAKRPTIVVMDLNVPRHDGIEILEAIRESAELADLPIAVLSSCVSLEDRKKVQSFRAAFVEKPLNLDDCLKVGEWIKDLALTGKVARASAP